MRDYRALPLTFPSDLTLVPLEGDASRVFEVEAAAHGADDEVITVARLRGGYEAGASRTLRLTLEDQCIGIVCSAGFTCRSGACVQLTAPDSDAGTPADAGRDGGSGPCTTGEQCDDGVYCNGVEVCRAGACEPGEPIRCDDGVDCTEDACEGTGCAFIPRADRCTLAEGGACDPVNDCQYAVCDATTCRPSPCRNAACEMQSDGTVVCERTSACSAGEACCGTMCRPVGCSDGNECTRDACDAATSECTHEDDDGRACSDGDACTAPDVCAASACVPGSMRTCDDTNPCTRDECNRATGECASMPDDTLPCAVLDDCLVSPRCVSGACVSDPVDCSDGVACTLDTCRGGECRHAPDGAMCPGGTCTPTGCSYPGTCNTATNCVAAPCERTTCMGDVCLRMPLCAAGESCCGGACMNCDDGQVCTMDGCSGSTCGHTPITAPCSDGNACTVGDACSGGVCVGTSSSCDDANPCTTDSCDTVTGCRNTPLSPGSPCSDGNACTSGETCGMAGTCGGGVAVVCPDPGPCATVSCVAPGGCVVTPRPPGSDCGSTGCFNRTCTAAGTCATTSACTGRFVCCPEQYCDRPEFCSS
jgi:hypothetical protein